MRPPILPGNPRRAFTLIELLVVIAIIALLAGLLLPVIGSVMEHARKTSAKATESQIVNAVNSYQTEYGQYPIDPTVTTDYTFDGTVHNGILFNVLRAINSGDATTSALNSRRIVYFESKNVKNNTAPKDGFVTASTTGNNNQSLNANDLVDPWGNLYFVRIDGNYTSVLKNPYSDPAQTASDDATNPATATDLTVLRVGVIAYSYGKDGMIGASGTPVSSPYTSVGDDVDSWQ
jgi:prepilin-type N-terminal cleavage/methylation domain-containing protein